MVVNLVVMSNQFNHLMLPVNWNWFSLVCSLCTIFLFGIRSVRLPCCVSSFYSKHNNYLFVMLTISADFLGKGLVTTKGFKGSFADAASSAKVWWYIFHCWIPMFISFVIDFSLLTIILRILSVVLDICCSCRRSKFGFLLFEKATWQRWRSVFDAPFKIALLACYLFWST